MAEPSFTFPYPIAFASDGSMRRDTTSLSQLRMLASTAVGQWIHDRGYGFPPHRLKQGLLSADNERILILVGAQRKVVQYVKTLVLQGLGLSRDVAKRLSILDIHWVEKHELKQPFHTLLGLGVDG